MCINWNSSSIGEQRKSNIISKKDNVSFRRNGKQTNNRVDLKNPEVSFGKLKDKKRGHKLSVSEIKKNYPYRSYRYIMNKFTQRILTIQMK